MRVLFAFTLLVGTSVCALARYVETHQLPDGRVAVVSEGDLEPRSIGSYSVRLYGARNKAHPTDDFLGGIVRPRDGTIEKVVLADVDGDDRPELVVVIRNAGSGSYLSADALKCGGEKPALLASVVDLEKNADVVSALRVKCASKAGHPPGGDASAEGRGYNVTRRLKQNAAPREERRVLDQWSG